MTATTDDRIATAAPASPWTVERALTAVAPGLSELHRLGVAFSGGVDSSVLLALAAQVAGPGPGGRHPRASRRAWRPSERAAAHEVAREIGVPVVEVDHARGRPGRRTGPTGRTAASTARTSCSRRIDDGVAAAAPVWTRSRTGRTPTTRVVRTGPGARAATNHAVLRPLADGRPRQGRGPARSPARSACRVADKPAAPCLASRIPHLQPVTPEKLRQIEQAEEALRGLGFGDLRVRHHGEVARIELTADDLLRAVTEPLRGQVLRAVRGAGFRFVTVDLAGIQSGAFTLPLRHGPTWLSADDRGWPDSPSSTSTGRRAAATRRRSTARARPPSRSAVIAAAVRDRPAGHPVHPGRPGARRGRPAPSCPDAFYDADAGLLAWPAAPARADRRTGRRAGRRHLRPAGRPGGPAHRPLPGPARPSWWSTSAWPACTGCWPGWSCCAGPGSIVVAAGMDGALPSVVAGLVSAPGGRRADLGGLRRRLRGTGGAAGHAQRLRARGRRGQHRQRLRRRPPRRPDRRPVRPGDRARPARLDRRVGRHRRRHAAGCPGRRGRRPGGRADRGRRGGPGCRTARPPTGDPGRPARHQDRRRRSSPTTSPHRTWATIRDLSGRRVPRRSRSGTARWRTFARLAEAEAAGARHPARGRCTSTRSAPWTRSPTWSGSPRPCDDLGVDHASAAGAVAVGSGRVRAAHGDLPVPVPAVVRAGRPAGGCTRAGTGELTTPTGMALVAALAAAVRGPAVAGRAARRVSARAAGTTPDRPNVTRVLVGDSGRPADPVPETREAADGSGGQRRRPRPAAVARRARPAAARAGPPTPGWSRSR